MQTDNITYDHLPEELKKSLVNRINTDPMIWGVLNKVQSDLAKVGIEKTGDMKISGSKASVRKVEEVVNVLCPILVKHQLNMRTHTLSEEVHWVEETIENDSGIRKTKKPYILARMKFVFTAIDGSFVDSTFTVLESGASFAFQKAYSAGLKLVCSHLFFAPFESCDPEDDRFINDRVESMEERIIKTAKEPVAIDEKARSAIDYLKSCIKEKDLDAASEAASAISYNGIHIKALLAQGEFNVEEVAFIRSPEFIEKVKAAKQSV